MKSKMNDPRPAWIPLIFAVEWWRHLSLRAGGGGFSHPKKGRRSGKLRQMLAAMVSFFN